MQNAIVVVGLGNPGEEYAETRHNVGFMLLDAMVESYGLTWKKQFKGELARGQLLDLWSVFEKKIDKWREISGKLSENGRKLRKDLFFLKPYTYMNRSGEAVGELAKFFKLAASQVMVVHDDIDLPLGRVKLKRGGGHGGHNGLRSIDAAIGRDYYRLRIGVGRPPRSEGGVGTASGDGAGVTKRTDTGSSESSTASYVLAKFRGEERRRLDAILRVCLNLFPLLLAGEVPMLEEFAQFYNAANNEFRK